MLRCIFALLFAVAVSTSGAATVESVTLARIAKTGKMIVGYVPDAPPMSFRDEDGAIKGYSIDLCKRVAQEVGRTLNVGKLQLVYVPLVAPEDRIKAVESGKVDIECGASTVTLSRRQRVDFTLMTYITGGSVLSRKSAPVRTTAGLVGKRIAVIKGTTTEKAVREFMEANDFDYKLRMIATHEDGIRLLRAGEVDAYASDRAMLIGQALRSPDAKDFVIASDVFSFEPYALMLARGDTGFRLAADRALAGLYRTARIRRLHQDWFGRFGEPLSPLVEAMYEFQAVGE